MVEGAFQRYLAAKKAVDDRALNRLVWERFLDELVGVSTQAPLRILEAGAGIGAMLERLLASGRLKEAAYTGVDAQPENLRYARRWLSSWASNRGYQLDEYEKMVILTRGDERFAVEFVLADVFDYAATVTGSRQWDVLIAHAFLDLIPLPGGLRPLFDMLGDEAFFYFPINFDGLTILEPVLDPHLDEQILQLYHATMDQRLTGEMPSGDSCTGRRLFQHLLTADGEILAAGSSDWVVYPTSTGYPDDEAYFLHFIIDTIHRALQDHPDLDEAEFDRWVTARRAQIESGELIYIAHQLDILGRLSGADHDR